MNTSYLKSCLFIILMSFSFSAVPNWDCNYDGVLDNYNDYQNNGSITLSVSVNGSDLSNCDNWVFTNEEQTAGYCDSENHDLFAAFVDGEQRGAGALTYVPFGPYAGTYQFLTLVYSNQASGETVTYKFYDYETDTIYDISETTPFVSDMILGSVVGPEVLTTSGVTSDCYDDCEGTEHGECNE